MQFIPHVAVGVLIGQSFHSLPLVAGLSLASHFLLDALPHWDPAYEPGTRGVNLKRWKLQPVQVRKQAIGVLGTQFILILTFFISQSQHPKLGNLYTGALFSVLPDLYEWIGGLFGLPSIHFFNQKHIGWKKGFIIPVVASLGSLLPFLKI